MMLLALNGNSLSGAEIVSCWGTTAVAATQPSVAQLATYLPGALK